MPSVLLKGEDHMKMEIEEHLEPLEDERGKKGFHPRPVRGNRALLTEFGFLVLTYERMHFLWF
jgi:hypothetical protein